MEIFITKTEQEIRERLQFFKDEYKKFKETNRIDLIYKSIHELCLIIPIIELSLILGEEN